MDRFDFIEDRVDVIKNIYTLYSYTIGDNTEYRDWAVQRFKQGQWFIVEPFGDTLMFGPSRFVGYKDNNIEKHQKNHGDGKQTNKIFLERKIYKKIADEYISAEFEKFINRLGIERVSAKFLIPYSLDVEDLKYTHPCYFISPTHCAGQKKEAWKSFLTKGIIAIGWDSTDYSSLTTDDIKTIYAGDPKAIYAFNLIKQIKAGDIICCTNNNFGLWGIGIALSSYKFKNNIHYAGIDNNDNESYYSHYIEVAWLNYQENNYIPTSDLNIHYPERIWTPYGTISKKDIIPNYIKNFLLKISNENMEAADYIKYITLLEANKNLILTGAPGTGKTHIAKAIAKAMDAEYELVQFHPSYDYTDFVEGLRPTNTVNTGIIGFERRNGVFKDFCHKALSYCENNKLSKEEKALKKFKEDLDKKQITIQSSRSTTLIKVSLSPTKNISVPDKSDWCVRDDKMLKYLKNNECHEKDTYTMSIGDYIKKNYMTDSIDKEKKFVFIIDEINRGELSKIFGELFLSIDPGYRDATDFRVKTQYQNLITDKSDPFYDGFYIPSNVYIIGTMNDIDRSVESMDFAMRRRFAWKEVTANENTGMLDNLKELKDEVVATMQHLNKAIWDDNDNIGIEGLSSAYHIGGAYFSKLSLYLNDTHSNKEEAYKLLWNNHLKGVLFEYLRGTPDAMENLKKLENAYYNKDTYDTEG